MEPFEYPEDRGELFGEANPEEAWFYFALNDFEHAINKYGAHFVLSRMRSDAFEKLSEWFSDTSINTQKEKAWLLTKQTC